MQTRILKECRALLPLWVAALILTALPALLRIPPNEGEFLWLITLGLGGVLVSVESFGKEFTHRTLPMMLSQPISRRRFWFEKTGVLALALGGLAAVFAVCGLVFAMASSARVFASGATLLRGLLVLFCCFGGGLFLTLLTRQATAGFWFTLFLPAALVSLIQASANWLSDTDQARGVAMQVTCLVLLVYSVVSLLLARRLFDRLEDREWLGAEVSLPFRFGRAKPATAAVTAAAGIGMNRSLIRKELHLQQINFLFCGSFIALCVVLLVGNIALGGMDKAREFLDDRSLFTPMFWCLWALLPVLIGAVSITEERKLAVLEWQQCQPPSRKRQFTLKLLTVFALSLVLGGLVPWLLSNLASMLTNMHFGDEFYRVLMGEHSFRGLIAGGTSDPGFLLGWMVYAIAVSTLGFYASSLTRNLLHCLSLLIGLVITGAVLYGSFAFATRDFTPSPTLLFGVIAVPALFVLLLVLAFRNYALQDSGQRTSIRNASVLALATVAVLGATLAVYSRSWESLLPEPSPSGAPLSGTVTPKIASAPDRALLLLPGGSLWGWGHVTLLLLPDGSLWGWGHDIPGGTGQGSEGYAHQPVRIMSESSWKDASVSGAAYVIKSDGTLWAWGTLPRPGAEEPTPINEQVRRRYGLIPASPPEPVDTNRARVATLKRFGLHPMSPGEPAFPFPRSFPASPPVLPGRVEAAERNTDANLTHSDSQGSAREEMRALTTRRYGLPTVSVAPESRLRYQYEATPIQIGTSTGWKAVSASFTHVVALKNDGSLWAWGQNNWGQLGDGTTTNRAEPVRAGSDNDWVSAVAGPSHTLAIKKDGSLWEWGFGKRVRSEHGTPNKELGTVPERIGNATNWFSVSRNQVYCVGIQSDGSLWVWGDGLNPLLGLRTGQMVRDPVRVGADSDWVAASGEWGNLQAIKKDGTLWQWHFLNQLARPTETDREPVTPVRVGKRTDWVAVGVTSASAFGLTSDGGLWTWYHPLKWDARASQIIPFSRRPSLVMNLASPSQRQARP